MPPTYTVELTAAAGRQLRKLDRAAQHRIITALEVLQENPRPPAVRALVGHPGYLRIRTGHLRIVYTVVDARLLILVLALGDRRDVYESLERST